MGNKPQEQGARRRILRREAFFFFKSLYTLASGAQHGGLMRVARSPSSSTLCGRPQNYCLLEISGATKRTERAQSVSYLLPLMATIECVFSRAHFSWRALGALMMSAHRIQHCVRKKLAIYSTHTHAYIVYNERDSLVQLCVRTLQLNGSSYI